jgi:hypothetical protein
MSCSPVESGVEESCMMVPTMTEYVVRSWTYEWVDVMSYVPSISFVPIFNTLQAPAAMGMPNGLLIGIVAGAAVVVAAIGAGVLAIIRNRRAVSTQIGPASEEAARCTDGDADDDNEGVEENSWAGFEFRNQTLATLDAPEAGEFDSPLFV